MRFPFFKQYDQMDCGATCLRMIFKYYGKQYSLETLRKATHISKHGVSLLGLSEAAEGFGFRTILAKIDFNQLSVDAVLPCILHWKQRHFVVLPPQNLSKNKINQKILVADPAHGIIKVDRQLFLQNWIGSSSGSGVTLLMEPTPTFMEQDGERDQSKGLMFLIKYVKPYRRLVFQLVLSICLGSLLTLIFPFLTQSLIDRGVNYQDVGFIAMILISQLILFLGATANEMLRSWILLHMNSRINISIISDFLLKLMRLPIRFFDSKMIGDLTQRINDHDRIERFLTLSTMNAIFSLVNLIVFAIVLSTYSVRILFIFLGGALLSVAWIQLFMSQRKNLDYSRFQQQSQNQNQLFELITAMQEIKLNNCEVPRRWQWERIQTRLFKLNVKGLLIEQYQQSGTVFFNQLKNILISYVAALQVVEGQLTLGMMLSISFIIGQMNAPIDSLLVFFRTAQDARISLERLSEIHNQKDEESIRDGNGDIVSPGVLLNENIELKDLNFRYGGNDSPFVLKGINLNIPCGKVTAIVGSSGSGKTTLLKLLLGFYPPSQGQILVGDSDLSQLSPKRWRSMCGVVMQEGYIFSDTIAKNIDLSGGMMNEAKLRSAVELANIESFVKDLPMGFETKIGNSGTGISTGQRQRILIARAVYKDPRFLFFDEATSALDANNEKVIIGNLNRFFTGRTVVVIAHRLSTVRHADQIIVLENGSIIETGNHQELTIKKGRYYELVKNQLELTS